MKKYSKEQITEVINNSISIRQVIKKLGLIPAGGNYATVRRYIELYSIDISHFKGQGHNKGKKLGSKRPLDDYLSNKFSIQSYKLKNRLLKECVFHRKCYSCERTSWLNHPIPLELEHIDGNHLNNKLDNLTLLCPNCHAFTSTYRGKNISKKS